MKRNNSYFLKVISELEEAIEILENLKDVELERREEQILRLLYYTCGTVRTKIREILRWDNERNGNNKISKE